MNRLLRRALVAWKRLSPAERALWTLAAWSLWAAAMGLGLLARTASPQLAVDAAALRQLPELLYDDEPRHDPWGNVWSWQPALQLGRVVGLGDVVRPAPGAKPNAWYRRAGAPEATPDGVRWGDGAYVEVPPPDPLYSLMRLDYLTREVVAEASLIYSKGPSGRDEGGAGDDLFPRAPGLSTFALAWSREAALVSALLLVWLIPWARLRRSPSLAREALRTVVAAAPALGVVAYLTAAPSASLTHWVLEEFLPRPPFTSWQVAFAGSCGVFLLLAAAALRGSRSPERAE